MECGAQHDSIVGFGGGGFGVASGIVTSSAMEMEERRGKDEISWGEMEDEGLTLGADCTLVPPPITSVGERAARCCAA